jgi:hypothetical protein
MVLSRNSSWSIPIATGAVNDLHAGNARQQVPAGGTY